MSYLGMCVCSSCLSISMCQVTLGSADPVPLEDKGDDDNNANNMSIDDVSRTEIDHTYTHIE